MFLPVRDNIPSERRPIVRNALIAACSAVFLYQVLLSETELDVFVARYAMVPAELFGGEDWARWATLITSMFLHGGWMHLLGNMLFLYIFGDNVEDAFGHVGFVVVYLATGLVGGLAQASLEPQSPIPTLGASGAISGVLGAYFVLFPHARVIALLFAFFFLQAVEVPAFFFLGFWFLIQLFQGVGSLGGTGAEGGVAWWAHIGGFVAGMSVGLGLRLRR